MTILNEFVVLPPAMEIRSVGNGAVFGTSFQFELEMGKSDPHHLRLGALWFLDRISKDRAGWRWSSVCQQAKELGIAIQCSASDLDAIPRAERPTCIARQPVDEPLKASDLLSADMVELVMNSPRTGRWGWPAEIEREDQLAAWIEAIRVACGRNRPLAIGLPVGVDDRAVDLAIASGADMIALHAPMGSDPLLAHGLARTFRRIQSLREGMPILLHSHHRDPKDFIKLIALGASLVSIDGYMEEVWNSIEEVPEGFSISGWSGNPRQGIDLFSYHVQQLNDALRSNITAPGKDWLADLRSRLRAVTDRARRLAEVPMLAK